MLGNGSGFDLRRSELLVLVASIALVALVVLTSDPPSCQPSGRDAHGELTMANAAEPADVSIDGNVVGRISEDQVGALGAGPCSGGF